MNLKDHPAKRVYISGPMTGRPDLNFPLFHEVEEWLLYLGKAPINPARNFGGRTDLPVEAYLKLDLMTILTSTEAVVVLRGWEKSRGARLEVLVAQAIGLPLFEYPGGPRVEVFENIHIYAVNSQEAVPVLPVRGIQIEAEPFELLAGTTEVLRGVLPRDDRRQWESGAQRDTNAGKTRPDLISPYAIRREADVLARGAAHYGDRNWQKGMPFSAVLESLERHVLAYRLGKDDEDHLASIRCNAGFLIHFEEAIKTGLLPAELDDRHLALGDGKKAA